MRDYIIYFYLPLTVNGRGIGQTRTHILYYKKQVDNHCAIPRNVLNTQFHCANIYDYGQSGRFPYQRSAVRIEPKANSMDTIFIYSIYCVDELSAKIREILHATNRARLLDQITRKIQRNRVRAFRFFACRICETFSKALTCFLRRFLVPD